MHVPEWVKDAVFYQIFPDRFARSVELSKPANLQPWGDPPTAHQFQGGDLLGIAERLDYLTDLGINALYLCPIFQSAANHRYHTHDYYRVDPILGGNDALHHLVKKAHERGIRIVLDGVFNHASRGFFQFSDILENGPDSPWIDWFLIDSWPLAPYDFDKPANYECWWDLRELPKLNTDNPEVRRFILDVAEYWITEFEIDGWRLDVPEEIITPGFWEEFRDRVKGANPDAYIVGEIWYEAAGWVTGDRFDALMNYPLTEAILAYSAGDLVSPILMKERILRPYPKIDAEAFARRLNHLTHCYDWEVTQVQLNILDSHDLPRLDSQARGNLNAIELAVLVQMTLPGAPCVYYGDEIGIQGTEDFDSTFNDANARWAFPWDDHSEWKEGLLDYYKTIISLRHQHPALRRGQFSLLYAKESCCVYMRSYDQERLLVCLNNADVDAEIEVDISQSFQNDAQFSVVFDYQGVDFAAGKGRLKLSLPPRSGFVLAAEG